MSKTLAEIRKKLQDLDTKKNSYSSGSNDKSLYLHWNIPEGTASTVRFLPDANEENIFFWAERQVIKLPFVGIKGQDENKPVVVQVPCIEMWDGKNTCPILNEVRPWWKDPALEDTARKYWVKRTYYMQGIVKTDPMNESEPPENPIRKFIMGPQIFAIIKAALLDPDMEHSPVDFINGTDFIISKTSKGGYADYGTSKWARKESSISPEVQDAINEHGLVDLSTYLPQRPTAAQLAIIFDMFQASVDGELYDPELWSQHYKPFGFDSDDSNDSSAKAPAAKKPAPAPAPTPTRVVAAEDDDTPPFDADDDTPTPTPSAEGAAKSPQEILAMLRNRNK